jgi:hypothetical protein
MFWVWFGSSISPFLMSDGYWPKGSCCSHTRFSSIANAPDPQTHTLPSSWWWRWWMRKSELLGRQDSQGGVGWPVTFGKREKFCQNHGKRESEIREVVTNSRLKTLLCIIIYLTCPSLVSFHSFWFSGQEISLSLSKWILCIRDLLRESVSRLVSCQSVNSLGVRLTISSHTWRFVSCPLKSFPSFSSTQLVDLGIW